MPVIAIPYFNKGKLKAYVCACTIEEYNNYMEDIDLINSHTVSARYFKEYTLDKGYTVEDMEKNIKLSVSALGEDAFIQWSFAPVFTVQYIKVVLDRLGLSYAPFIDDYSSYLKTL